MAKGGGQNIYTYNIDAHCLKSKTIREVQSRHEGKGPSLPRHVKNAIHILQILGTTCRNKEHLDESYSEIGLTFSNDELTALDN